jgi:hypothetical protein
VALRYDKQQNLLNIFFKVRNVLVMKKCPRCGLENSDEMRFCLQCGTSLPDSPQIVGNLQDSSMITQSLPDMSFNKGLETQLGGKSFPTNLPLPAQTRPKSNRKLLIAFGGIILLILLIFVVGAGVVGYNLWKKKTVVYTPTPLPTQTVNKPPSPTTSPSATPQTSFTPPIEATKKGSFTVYANEDWQLSDIDTVPLENYRTSTQGLIDLAGIKNNVTPKGVNDAKTKSRRIYPEYPTGALLMRTRYSDGKYSNVQPVAIGSGLWQNFPDERGRLEFCINDNSPSGNGGQFIVTVTMTSVPKQKK